MAQTVKRLPAMRETQVLSLGQEYPLEKGMATHSSTLAWKIPWTEEPQQADGGISLSISLIESVSHSVVSHSLQHHGLQPTRLLEWVK